MPAMAMPQDADTGLISIIAGTPAVKKALREHDEAVTAARARLIADVHRIEVVAESETPKLGADAERITAELRKAEAAVQAVQQRLGAALLAKHNFGVAFSRRHDELEAALRATASPLIASFVAEMRAAWDKTRRAPLVQQTATTAAKSEKTGRPETYLATNAALVARRLQAIRETILAAEELALTVADQSEIPALLGELAARLPSSI
jgi:dihydroxyacetone kinase DhaKLM complex PTS-EIIA-like component DhaM